MINLNILKHQFHSVSLYIYILIFCRKQKLDVYDHFVLVGYRMTTLPFIFLLLEFYCHEKLKNCEDTNSTGILRMHAALGGISL